MDSRTENLKAELKRLHVETAERVVCRRIDSLVRPAFPGNVMGGRGVCRYCGEVVNNVAYHESNACNRRPNDKDEARR